MDSTVVNEAARGTLAGTMPFPEVVRRLIETGVEYYHVDYVALRKTFLLRWRRDDGDRDYLRRVAGGGGGV